MKNKYSIRVANICPFIFLSGINIIPDLNYPPRLCVVNEEEGFAIDIDTELKYDYLEAPSRLYINSMVDKVKDNKRVAILSNLNYENIYSQYPKGLKIIEQLKSGRKFENGNDVYNNDQYLEYLDRESTKKVKKIEKRRK